MAGRGGAEVVYTFPVGLGRFDWKTPVGNWRVRGKTKEPTWVVPEDIYEEHLERDGEAEHVVSGGDPDNPLGHYRIELTLPEYALHGTNVPWGVGMTVSHGCIRLAEPKRLAEFLLRNEPAWNEASITRAMNSGKEKYVPLKQTIPVFIGYFTAWVDRDGKLNFRDDIYGHDKEMAEHLFSTAKK